MVHCNQRADKKTTWLMKHATSLVLYPTWCTLLNDQQTVWDLTHGLWDCGYQAHQDYLSCSVSQSSVRGQQGWSVWMAWLALLHYGPEHLTATDRLWLRLYKQSSAIGGAVVLRGRPPARTRALNQLVCVRMHVHACIRVCRGMRVLESINRLTSLYMSVRTHCVCA